MTCDKYQGQMEEWLDGELGQNARAGLERHLRICPDCAQYLDQRRHLGTALKKTVHELTGDLHFQPRPLTLSAEKRHPLRRLYFFSFSLGKAFALAAVPLLVILFLFHPWAKSGKRTAGDKLPTMVITVSDSLNMADESFISGRCDGINYRIHLQVLSIRINDHT